MNLITPIFPCKSLDELMEFYKLLGFTVTYHQKSPNPYAVLERDWIRLDFYGIKHHDPAKAYHTCYILTDEVDTLYEEFTNTLRKKSGKLPTRGLPRISEIRDKAAGVREFMFSDIAGTCIRIGKKINADEDPASKRLSLALDFAYKSEDSADEYVTVAKVLDKAMERDKDSKCLNLYKVKLTRADIAIEQGDHTLAKKLLEDVKAAPAKFQTELKRITDLEQKMN
jgi:hypothetical protein